MSGYKLKHGLPTDPRLAVIAKKANINNGEALAIWVTLMDYASQAQPCGSISNIDIEEIAIILGIELEKTERALAAFKNKKMTNSKGMIVDWEESQKNSSTLRTRAFRARKKVAREALLSAEQPKETQTTSITTHDSEEEVFKRRARLQKEMLARHAAKGKRTQTPNPA